MRDGALQAGERPIGDLMALAQAGDAEAYRAVLTWSRQWLLRYFSRRIAPSLVDDLVQETLVSIHAKRATYDPARPFLPWLAAIARYRWVDQLRRDYRDGGARVEEEIAWDGDVESEVTARISIDRMLAKLPPGQSQAIRLVKIDGLSVAEASIRANQSESLIKVNIHRGLKRLAAEIGRE